MSNTLNNTQRPAGDSSSMTLRTSSSQLRNEPSTSKRSSSRAPASWEQMRGGGHRLWHWLGITCCALSLGLLLIGLRASSSAPAVAAKRIDQIQVGDRVPTDTERGDNDLRFGEDVDPATWRQLELTAPKTDGTAARVTLLRPLTWIQEQRAQVGGTVTFAAPECGILGDARVDAIHPCPPIRGAQGRIVTGVFRHQSAEILELRLASGETIRTTPNHRFWSETRQDYVPAEDLQRNEMLRDGSGLPIAVVDIERLGQPHPVFNLEVQADHVFFVGKSGTLVHNATAGARVRAKLHRMLTFASEWQAKNFAFVAAEVVLLDGKVEMWVAGPGKSGALGHKRMKGRAKHIVHPASDSYVSRLVTDQAKARVNDAERHIIREAKKRGAKIRAIGATLPVCDNCKRSLKRAGFIDAVVTPLKCPD